MHPAFTRADHRPWGLPERPWSWRQSWLDLLFLHWPVPVKVLRPLVPAELEIQEFDGTSWVGVVPFRMVGVTRRYLPDLPWVSAFPEFNVRLYVEAGGKPGVWFLSLDATNPLAVWAARRFFHLPYHRADIEIVRHGHRLHYDARRRDGTVGFRARYEPVGAVYESRPGTLEHWLTERYCLYAKRPDGVLLRNDVHHVPWPLQRSEAHVTLNTLLEPHGIGVTGAPLCHFARRVDVVVWNAERCRTGSGGSS